MKKITFLFILLTASLGYSQTVLEDFEGGAIPQGAGGVVGENVTSFTQLANPDAGAGSGNESATVMELITDASTVPWQNGQLYFQNGNLDLTDGNTTGNKLVSVDVWSNAPTSILAKAVDGVGGVPTESATDASHGGTGWETLTFDFSDNKDNSAVANDVYGRILFFPVWNGAGYDGAQGAVPVFTTYYDNITKLPAPACTADAGTVTADNSLVALNAGTATLTATATGDISVPGNYETTYVLTSGSGLVIQQVSTTALSFDVTSTGLWTLHTLVAETSDMNDPDYLDLSIVEIGVTTGVDVLNAIDAAGICASLDAAGAPVTVVSSISRMVLEDFENGSIPQGAGGVVGENVTSFTQLANPDAGAGSGNESATVMELITDATTVPWQNGQLYFQNDDLDLTGSNKLVSVDVWSDTPTFILAKAVDGVGGVPTESATDASHGGSGWETLTFDFSINKDNSVVANDVYGRLLFFPVWNGAGYDGAQGAVPVFTTYYDNIAKVSTLSSNDVEKLSFKAFPNPTQNNWTITTRNENILSIHVFDVLGKNVLSLSPNERRAVIDGSSFKSGLYFAQIKTVSGLSSLKLIKR
jgi:hypothetical protein